MPQARRPATMSATDPGARGGAVDRRLALRAARRERRAFEQIYERHHQELYRYCMSLLRNREDAEDALQATMAAALRSLPGEKREIALRPWLFRVAHNESISLLRARQPRAPMDETLEARDGSAEAQLHERDRLRRLVADLRSLPERQSSALVMRELSGLSYGEIGATLATSEAAARQAVYEARRALRDFEEGREMECEDVRLALSDRDGRRLRGRRLRAHLEGCDGCRGFAASIQRRREDLAALCPPLPAAAATALFGGLIGAGGGSGSAGMAAAGAAAGTGVGAGGLAGSGLAGSAALKGASVLAAATLAAGAAEVGGVIDLSGGDGDATVSRPEGQGVAEGGNRANETPAAVGADELLAPRPERAPQRDGESRGAKGPAERSRGRGSGRKPAAGGGRGRSGTAPGRDAATGGAGQSPGRSSSAPGRGGLPGNSASPPGQGGPPLGNATSAPGQGGSSPGNSGSAPGKAGAPGQAGTSPSGVHSSGGGGDSSATSPGSGSGSSPGSPPGKPAGPSRGSRPAGGPPGGKG